MTASDEQTSSIKFQYAASVEAAAMLADQMACIKQKRSVITANWVGYEVTHDRARDLLDALIKLQPGCRVQADDEAAPAAHCLIYEGRQFRVRKNVALALVGKAAEMSIADELADDDA